MAELLQRSTSHTEPGNLTDCVMATGTPPDVMMTFHCELKDVMATLLDAAVTQILKLVQKDFLDKLKHNEQEIQVFQERLKMVESLQKERADETREKGKEKTCQPEMRAEEKQRRRETGTELSTNEFEVIEELAGDKGNTEDGVSIHKNKVENAGGDEEHGGVGAVRGTGSDIRAGGEVDFTGSGGNAGKEIQREKEGQKRRGKQKRLRVKSEMEDGGDIMNEKRSSLEELVVLKVEDPLHGEGTQSPASAESPGGAELQVYLLEDHDNLCNGIFCCDATSVKNVLKMEIPTSLNESTAQSTAVAADSQLSDGVKRNRSRSSLPAFYPQTKISQDALAEVKVALTKMEGLPDSGWVLLDPVTGHFCVKADLDSVTDAMGRDGRGDAPDGPGADPGVSCTRSVGMGVQMTTNSNTQTEAQITVTMSDDEVHLNSTAADGVEPNRVLTRSSKANRASSSSAKTTETDDVHSQRGCTTRSNGNRVAPRIDECVEKSANTASCPSGPPAPMRAVHTDSLSDPPMRAVHTDSLSDPPMRAVHTDSLSDPPMRAVHTDSGKGNDRLSKEACQDISGKVQQAKAKKDHTINVQASEASTSNNSPVESDQANFSAVEKDRKHCPFIEAKVYRAGHFIISQGSLTNRKNKVTKKSSGQIYTARVEVCDTSAQGFKVKEEHQGKQTVFECQHCAKTFPTLKSMQKHWKYHSPNKTHICSHCGKGYVYKCHLKIHMQSHTRERPHQCKQCGKRFIYRSNLKSHLVYHTGEKPHVCLQCGMAFSRHGYLINHVTIHSGLRPYGCSDCGKKFTTKGGLKRHEGIHLKKKTNG